MAEKKYYWLKLKTDFFTDKPIKKLRKIAGGDTYTIIYLKLLLASLKDDGNMIFEGIEDSFAEEIALDIDEDPENVKVTLNFLIKHGLIEQVSEEELKFNQVQTLIGKECDSAERVRKLRERKQQQALQCNDQALQCNGNVTNCNGHVTKCNTEIDIEIDIEKELEKDKEIDKEQKKEKEKKHKYGAYQHVLLTDSDMNKLINELGNEMYSKCITFLDEYIEMKGYKAKNHYLAIKKWVVNAVNEQESKSKHKKEYHKDVRDMTTEEYTKMLEGFV